MSRLRVYAATDARQTLAECNDPGDIAAQLAKVGVRFERWQAKGDISPGDAPDVVMNAYSDDIDRLMSEGGYQAVDVISLSADHPDKDALRSKFLNEHTHAEDEVRFFVAGQGLFFLHIDQRVHEVLCTAGDLISVPANTRHWFDMGPNPGFVAIRIFSNPEGWVANFTGDSIASRFPRLEN